MYFFARDKFTGTGVGVLSPKPSFDENRDYERMTASIVEIDDTPPPMQEMIYILSVQPDCPPPNATWRKRFAEMRDKLKHPMFFALQSPNGLIRGVSTAVNWLSPPKKGSSGSFATIEEAVLAIEKRYGRPMPILQKLYIEATTSRRS